MFRRVSTVVLVLVAVGSLAMVAAAEPKADGKTKVRRKNLPWTLQKANPGRSRNKRTTAEQAAGGWC